MNSSIQNWKAYLLDGPLVSVDEVPCLTLLGYLVIASDIIDVSKTDVLSHVSLSDGDRFFIINNVQNVDATGFITKGASRSAL